MKKILKTLIVLYIILGLGVGIMVVKLESSKNQEDTTTQVAAVEEAAVEEVVEETTEPEETVEETVEEATEETTEEVVEEAEETTEDTEATDDAEETEEQTFSDEAVGMVVDEENPHYYRFEILHGGCNVRTGPGTENSIIYTTKNGDTGYVIEAGESWSKIATERGVGYSFNRFLTTYEINKSEIPEEYFEE